MKRFWRAVISVTVGSIAGLAFYQTGGNMVYAYRHSSHLATYDPLLVTSCLLTLPITAVATLAVHSLLKRVFGPR